MMGGQEPGGFDLRQDHYKRLLSDTAQIALQGYGFYFVQDRFSRSHLGT